MQDVRTGDTCTPEPVNGASSIISCPRHSASCWLGVGAVEDHIATAHLCCRNLTSSVVLVTGVVRQLDANARERTQHDSGAIEAL